MKLSKQLLYFNIFVFFAILSDILGVYLGFWGKSSLWYTSSQTKYTGVGEVFWYFLFAMIATNVFIMLIYFYDILKEENILRLICPSCEEVKQVKLKKGETAICPKCHVKMVSLKGFYDKKREDEKKT